MSLTRVTISGADDDVSPTALAGLSDEFRFVEWGILFSESRQGSSRYPSAAWRRVLESTAANVGWPMHLSAHYCGAFARGVLEGKRPFVWSEYDRLQVNGFRATNELLKIVGQCDVEWILQARSESLLQDAANIREALPRNAACRISALWDSSGGRGIEPFSWPRAPLGLSLGYAGGIDAENVLDVLNAIGPVSKDFWIDMESGVRTDDRFDYTKVRRVLETVAPFVEEPTATAETKESET